MLRHEVFVGNIGSGCNHRKDVNLRPTPKHDSGRIDQHD